MIGPTNRCLHTAVQHSIPWGWLGHITTKRRGHTADHSRLNGPSRLQAHWQQQRPRGVPQAALGVTNCRCNAMTSQGGPCQAPGMKEQGPPLQHRFQVLQEKRASDGRLLAFKELCIHWALPQNDHAEETCLPVCLFCLGYRH